MKAMFGAGCFWGVQYYFDQVPGVTKTTAGYSGGRTKNPTYEDVCYKDTGHAEVVLVEFNPEQISYQDLLKQFFRMHDPTQLNRQGPDVGDQYRSVIYYFDAAQKSDADAVLKDVDEDYERPVVTQIAKAGQFYEAEAYHQKYAERTGRGMCHVPYQPV